MRIENCQSQKNAFFSAVKLLAIFLVFPIFTAEVFAESFPRGPDERLTRGSLCENGDSHRYPEGIEYCRRNVSSRKKWDIIESYEALGYEVRSYGRENFKIDHYIPLCAGGSNDVSNLWPQHVSVYQLTDRIEEMSCRLMAQGRLTQAEAVALIIEAKLDLEKAPTVEATLELRLESLSLLF